MRQMKITDTLRARETEASQETKQKKSNKMK